MKIFPDSALCSNCLADFCLYVCPVISYNHHYNSLRWALWVRLSNCHTWGWFGEAPNMSWCQSEGVLCERSPVALLLDSNSWQSGSEVLSRLCPQFASLHVSTSNLPKVTRDRHQWNLNAITQMQITTCVTQNAVNDLLEYILSGIHQLAQK